MFELLCDDITTEIIRYLPYTLTRSINIKFKNIADKVELSRSNQPVKYNKQKILSYLKTKPQYISFLYHISILTYRWDDNLSLYKSSSSLRSDYPLSYFVDLVNITNISFIIMGPNFIKFLLNLHPLNNNINYVRSRLIASTQKILDDPDINDFLKYKIFSNDLDINYLKPRDFIMNILKNIKL